MVKHHRRHRTANELSVDNVPAKRGRFSPSSNAQHEEVCIAQLYKVAWKLQHWKSGEPKESVMWADIRKQFKKVTGNSLNTDALNQMVGTVNESRPAIINGPLACLFEAVDSSALVVRVRLDSSKGDQLIYRRVFEAKLAEMGIQKPKNAENMDSGADTQSSASSSPMSNVSPHSVSPSVDSPLTTSSSPREGISPVSLAATVDYMTADDTFQSGDSSFLTALTSPSPQDMDRSGGATPRSDNELIEADTTLQHLTIDENQGDYVRMRKEEEEESKKYVEGIYRTLDMMGGGDATPEMFEEENKENELVKEEKTGKEEELDHESNLHDAVPPNISSSTHSSSEEAVVTVIENSDTGVTVIEKKEGKDEEMKNEEEKREEEDMEVVEEEKKGEGEGEEGEKEESVEEKRVGEDRHKRSSIETLVASDILQTRVVEEDAVSVKTLVPEGQVDKKEESSPVEEEEAEVKGEERKEEIEKEDEKEKEGTEGHGELSEMDTTTSASYCVRDAEVARKLLGAAITTGSTSSESVESTPRSVPSYDRPVPVEETTLTPSTVVARDEVQEIAPSPSSLDEAKKKPQSSESRTIFVDVKPKTGVLNEVPVVPEMTHRVTQPTAEVEDTVTRQPQSVMVVSPIASSVSDNEEAPMQLVRVAQPRKFPCCTIV